MQIPQEVILALPTMDETPITGEKIAKLTTTNPVLSRVRQFVERRWPLQAPSELEAYNRTKAEFSVQHGVLFWGTRVIIPPEGRDTPLEKLHETHPGIVKLKAVARSYLWWPGLDTETEIRVNDCTCHVSDTQQITTSDITASVGMARTDVAPRTH